MKCRVTPNQDSRECARACDDGNSESYKAAIARVLIRVVKLSDVIVDVIKHVRCRSRG